MKFISNILLFLLFLPFGQESLAQESQPKYTLGLNIGRAFPVGKYATILNNNVERSRFLQLNAGYDVNEDLSVNLVLQLGGAWNSEIGQELKSLFPGYNYQIGPINHISFYTTINRKFYIDQNKKNRFFTVFAGVGLEMNQTYYDGASFTSPNSLFENRYIYRDRNFSPVFVLGGAYEWNIYKRLFIKTLIDYQISNFGTEDIFIEFRPDKQNSYSLPDQHFGWLGRINFGLGFGIRFSSFS